MTDRCRILPRWGRRRFKTTNGEALDSVDALKAETLAKSTSFESRRIFDGVARRSAMVMAVVVVVSWAWLWVSGEGLLAERKGKHQRRTPLNLDGRSRAGGISLQDCGQSIKRIAVDVIPPAGLIFLRRLITASSVQRGGGRKGQKRVSSPGFRKLRHSTTSTGEASVRIVN